jgi:hypothetical protein
VPEPRGRAGAQAARRLALAATLAVLGGAAAGRAEPASSALAPTPRAPRLTAQSTPTPVPEPPPAFGRVVYRASKAASYESLGVPMIMCRHRDHGARTIAVEFFDRLGKKVSVFGPTVVPNVPPDKKIVFVSDAMHFPKRDVINMRVGHFTDGTARVVSDARIIHCMAKMRFDPGALAKTYWRSMGLYRPTIGATPAPVDW